jgi:hypothetical protein
MPQMLQTATASGALHWSGNSPLRMPSLVCTMHFMLAS